MNRKDVIKYCLELPDVYEDYPFQDDDSVTMKHKKNNKWFALIMNVRGEEYLNIKTNPKGYIEIDENCMTSQEGVFAGGDIIGQKATVAWAARAGRNAAEKIDEYLQK